MNRNLDIVGTAVIAEGQSEGSDARFTAEIKSMGRVPDTLAVDRRGIAEEKELPSKTTAEGGDGPNWELYGSIIGAVATIIAALLGVYFAGSRRCRPGKKETEGNVEGAVRPPN